MTSQQKTQTQDFSQVSLHFLKIAFQTIGQAQLVRLFKAVQSTVDELAIENQRWLNELLGGLNCKKLDWFQNLFEHVPEHLEETGVNTHA